MRTWEDWRLIHQPFELRYHLSEGIAWCSDEEQFAAFWGAIFDWIGPKGVKLDVGCGPRPPFGPASFALDPLADRYLAHRPQWWTGIEVRSQPAEDRVEDFVRYFDTVLCWNVLDHTIGWRAILANLAAYCGPDGRVAIATDYHEPMIGHPGFDRLDFIEEVEDRFYVVDCREDFAERHEAFILEPRRG